MMAALEEEEEEEANKQASISFNTRRVSGGATVYNINGNYITHKHFNPMPGYTSHETIHSQTFKRIHTASSMSTLSVAQLPRPSQPPNSQIATTSATVDYDSATRSMDQLRVMIGIVQTIMANPTLCSSKDLPKTLAALKRVLTLMELALRAYRHTDLVHSLSSAISIRVEECRPLLDELIRNLTSYRHDLSDVVLHFIQKYIWASAGQGSAVHALDSKLRKSHSSFAACLLALGRAAWPDLERGQAKETLDELAKLYVLLEQESTSLRHLQVDVVIVHDHLGRKLPVPVIFCMSSQEFHVVITGFCRDSAGGLLIRRGDYRIMNSEDDQVISPKEFATLLQPGMAVDMSIVFHEQAEERQSSEVYSCPRCNHISSRCTGWVTCIHCAGSFKISPEEESVGSAEKEESIVSPETEQSEYAGTDSTRDERSLFRKITILRRPADPQLRLASLFVTRVKTKFLKNNLPNMSEHFIHDQEKVEYNRYLEQAFHASVEMEPKLPMIFYALKDADLIKKLNAIIVTTREQQSRVSQGIQKYILSLITVKNIILQLRKCTVQYADIIPGFVLKPQANEDLPRHASSQVTDAMSTTDARGEEHQGFNPGMMQPTLSIQPHPLAMGTLPDAQVEGINNELAKITPQILAQRRAEGGIRDEERHAGNSEERQSIVSAMREQQQQQMRQQRQPPPSERQQEQQRGNKRNSTTLGEESESFPSERKRPRRSPRLSADQLPAMHPINRPRRPWQGGPAGLQHVPYGLMRPGGAPNMNGYPRAGIRGHTTNQAMMDMQQ